MTRIYDNNCNEITLEEAFEGYQLFDLDGDSVDISDNITYNLPRILSIHPCGRQLYEVKKELTTPLRTKIRQKHSTARSTHASDNLDDILEEVRKVVDIIKPSRAEEYDSWMKIGWAIYNVSDGHTDALDIWNDFSSKSEKYNEAHNLCLWDKMDKRESPGMGTLYYYAKLTIQKW